MSSVQAESYTLGYDTAKQQYQEAIRHFEKRIEELENERFNLRNALEEGIRELRDTVYNLDNAL